MVRRIDFVYYCNIVERTVQVNSANCSATHDRKLLNLRAHAISDNARLSPETVITNLSSYSLSDIEKRALAKGLNFSLPPPRLKKGKYLSSFELLFGDLSRCNFVGNSDDKQFFRKKLAELTLKILFNSYHNFKTKTCRIVLL